MKLEEYQAMGRQEDIHWYFRGKRRILGRVLAREMGHAAGLRILDVGCGTGATLRMLSEYGDVFGVDASPEALGFCQTRGIRRLAFADGGGLPFADHSFDLVCALDVLEHLQDDSSLVAEMVRVLKPGGLLLVTVPAFQFLWSDHDIALHHYRRYRAPQLRGVLERGGLRVTRLSYFNTALFPVACAVRLARRPSGAGEAKSDFFTALPAWLNAALYGVFSAEAGIVSRVKLPVGLSLLSTARRPTAVKT